MKLFRKILFWCHLTAGVAAGIVILIMCVTGVLLTYERQIIKWADTRSYNVAPTSETPNRLSVETLISKVLDKQSDATPTSVLMRSAEDEPAAFSYTGGRTVFINPYTGEVLGEGSKGVRNFFSVVTGFHRWLGGNGENRAIGRAVTGACNLMFLFVVCSGFYMWFPRKWTKPQLRNVMWFKRGLGGKARDFNWHNVIGFWSLIPLFIVVLSAVVISYTWAGNLVYRIVGETPPVSGGQPRPPQGQRTEIATDGLNQLWAKAEQQTQDWQSISLRLPTSADATATFTIDRGDGGQPQKRAQLTLDRKSGEVSRWEPFSNNTTGRKLRSILRFAHTGEVAGIFGQTIAGIVSLGGAFLVWTGLSLAWRRLSAWVARRKLKVDTVPNNTDLVPEPNSD